MHIRLEKFVTDISVTLLVSTSFSLTISSMICFVCDSIALMIVLVLLSVEEKPLLAISYCSQLMIYPFKDSISRFNTFISDIKRICGGVPVNLGVSSLLFQGWDICVNEIILLVMYLRIGYACKGHFLWSMTFNLL